MKKIIFVFLLIIVVFASFVFTYKTEEKAIRNDNEKGFIIYTSIYPIYEMVRNIGTDNLRVELIIPNRTEPHSYEPSLRKLAQLEKADLFFYIGLGLEPWAEKMEKTLNTTGVKTIELSKYIEAIKLDKIDHKHQEKEFIEYKDTDIGKEDDMNQVNEEEYHGEYDPHIWLDPSNMGIIASVIKDELINLDSDNRDIYEDNFQEYEEKLIELEKQFSTALDNKHNDTIIVSHAAFGYLAERYDFQQLSITSLTPHGEPTPGSLANLINTARDENLAYVFVEPQVDDKLIKIIADEAELEILSLNPFIGLGPEEIKNNDDYFSIMRKNLINLKKALVE